jgi:site-specific DNA-cytosine methylase
VRLGREQLEHHASAEATQQAASFRPPPPGFKPPTTEGHNIDRNPRHGFDGVITAGEFAAGSGSFVRYAKSIGIEVKWVAEKVPELEAAAAAEAGPGCQRHGDILDVHPSEVGEVFMLLGGPECQPFSKAGKQGGLQDPRARTFFWILWCLSIRQFPSAFIENVQSLLSMKDGAVWKLLKSVAEGIGYVVQVSVD